MADGSTKRIDEIKIGDLVLATDPTTGRTETRPVTALVAGAGEKDLVELAIGDAELVATQGHPVWAANRGAWVEAGDLEQGDRVVSADRRMAAVTSSREWTEYEQVFNLTVDGLHTYYVIAGTTDVLVHNVQRDSICPKHDWNIDKLACTKAGPQCNPQKELAGDSRKTDRTREETWEETATQLQDSMESLSEGQLDPDASIYLTAKLFAVAMAKKKEGRALGLRMPKKPKQLPEFDGGP
jgi:hypothetical protein